MPLEVLADDIVLADGGTAAAKEPSALTLVWRMVAPDKWLLAAAVVATVSSSLVSLLIPPSVGGLLASLKAGASFSTLWGGVAKLAGVVVFQASLSAGYIALLSSFSQRLVQRLRTALFDALMAKDMGAYDATRGGEFSALLSADVEAVRAAVKHCVSIGVRAVVVLVGGCVSLALISPQMTGILFCALPVSVWAGSIFARHLRGISGAAAARTASSLALADEYMANIRTVRAFGAEAAALELFASDTREATGLAASLGRRIGIFHGFTSLGLYGMVLGVISYGAGLVANGSLAPEAIVTFMLQASRMQSAFASLSILSGQAVKGIDAASRIDAVLSATPAIPLAAPHLAQPDIVGNVSFQHVSFRYPSRPQRKVLRDVSFDVPRGSVVALVGPSGSGKTTLAWLLMRLYDPEAGQVVVDGVPLTHLDPATLRSSMAIVSQEPDLFAGSIAFNIAFGRPDASRAEIAAAARVAAAADFIEAFPDGYDTLVGERGVQLSGGQKQRIAIARALLRDPAILILDEATSALDAEAEAAVQGALEILMRDRTTIVIAHRLSTIKNADNIVVIADGELVAQGSHTELLADPDSLYAALVAAQLH